MVDFAVFNELSLPFRNEIEAKKNFILFFHILSELSNRNITKIRMEEDFKNYQITEKISFQQYFGQITDELFQDRLREFITSSIISIDTPLIKDEEDEEALLKGNYSFKQDEVFVGGLACCDVWNSIAISFNSHLDWKNNFITIKKNDCDIQIMHFCVVGHLATHNDFFEDLEKEIKLNITQENFWDKKDEFFPNKILFCKEVEDQIKKLDKTIFKQAISILRDVENSKKVIYEYSMSSEKETVKKNDKMKTERTFTIDNQKVFFTNHLKSLSNANRIYFLEKDNKIYIGYIGKHLSNKNDKKN